MRAEIIRPDGDLKREIYNFDLSVDSMERIYFSYYSFQTRETTRHRIWKPQTYWSRLNGRNNNIESPTIPSDVEDEMRQIFSDKIKQISIVR